MALVRMRRIGVSGASAVHGVLVQMGYGIPELADVFEVAAERSLLPTEIPASVSAETKGGPKRR
jgi:hypothetical protein